MKLVKSIYNVFLKNPSAGIFYFGFSLLVIRQFTIILNIGGIGPLDFYVLNRILLYTTIILWIIKIIAFQKMTRFKMWLVYVLLAVALLTDVMSGSKVFSLILLFVLAGGDAKVKILSGLSLLIRLPVVCMAAFLTCIGVMGDVVSTRGDAIRHSMGFTHPNFFGHYLFCICLAVCVLRSGKKPGWEIALIALCAFLSLSVSGSRTSFLILIILGVIYVFLYYFRRSIFRKIFWAFSVLAAVGSAGISLIMMVVYTESNDMMSAVNSALSERFYLANLFYEQFPLTVFGYDYEGVSLVNGISGLYVDNAYAHLVLHYGIISVVLFVVILAVFFWSVSDCFRKKEADSQISELMGMCLYLIIGLSEKMLLQVEYNYFFIAASRAFYDYKRRDDTAEKTPLGWVRCVFSRGDSAKKREA